MKKVLVTGAAGFIGSSAVDALLARGDRVVGIDNFNAFYDPAIKRRNLAQAQAHPAFTLVAGDLLDAALIDGLFARERPDVVLHLAAWAGVRPSFENPQLYYDVNIKGSQHIIDACLAHPVSHLVFASSSSVYGGSDRIPFQEDDPISGPVSPYAATKRMNEHMCHVYSHVRDLRVTLLRFFTVYGPRQRPEMAIHKFARLIDAGAPVPMFGDGVTLRDYTYIDDILDGVLKAIDTPFRYEILNLGESHTTSLRDLIRMIGEALGKTPVIEEHPMHKGDVPVTYACIDKARELLGYAPNCAMEEGLRRFVAWYRAEQAR